MSDTSTNSYESIKNLFLNPSKLSDHIKFQNESYQDYISVFLILVFKYEKTLSIVEKARVLAASITNKNNILNTFLLEQKIYDLPTIVKTCEILDAPRYCRQLTKKLEKLDTIPNLSDAKKKKLKSKYKSMMSNFSKLHEDLPLSLTTAKSKLFRQWVNKIPASDLENNVIQYPKSYWKKLIDLLHLKQTDFQLNWFSSYIMTPKYNPPKSSLLRICSKINKNNILDVIDKYKLSYSYVKNNYPTLITDDVKILIAKNTPIDIILAQINQFTIEQVLYDLNVRISTGEHLQIECGELMKIIQALDKTFSNKQEDPLNIQAKLLLEKLINIANLKLDEYVASIDQPVVILGDASPSMDIAIKTSGIITAILSSICSAKVHLFRQDDEEIENPPKTVQNVIEFGKTCKTGGSTAPAASLYPYLVTKEIVKTFIIVTDEEENSGYDGTWNTRDKFFAPIFREYYETVYPAKLIFVSFLSSNKDGLMVQHIKELMPEYGEVDRFILHKTKPDLRKLDDMLNKLVLKTDNFYNKEADRTILWSDPEFGVDWGVSNPIVSEKDANAPTFAQSDIDFKY